MVEFNISKKISFFYFLGSLHPNVDKMLEKFIRGKEYQSAKYEEARGVLELRFGIVCHIYFSIYLFKSI